MLGFQKNSKIHFIGIGGIGMSGIAEVLKSLGYQVSGSDLNSSQLTEDLSQKGIEVFYGHKKENLENVSIVVYSSAIDENNPEIQQAKTLKIPIVRRAEMLSELMRLKFGIAIAGSHGKTTTTSLVATILDEAKLDATYIIGGVVHHLGGNAKKGDGQYLVAEADESDGSFMLLNPIISVITNIDNDHLDFYKNEKNIEKAFTDFANKVPFYGRVIINHNDEKSRRIVDELKRPHLKVGIARSLKEKFDLDYSADKIKQSREGTSFEVYRKEVKWGTIKTHLTGDHNVLNTLCALAVASELEIPLETINAGLAKFKGVGRRLELLYKKGDFEIIDDYGHHPTEIRATLKTLRDHYQKKLCVVFEPHRYSRTKELWNDFLQSFNQADEVIITPIYAASEPAISGITGESLVNDLKKTHPNARYLSDWNQLRDIVRGYSTENIVVLGLGAGSISKRMKNIIKEFK